MTPTELYRRYRPTTFKEMIGQDEAVKTLVSMVKKNQIPHALLMIGNSGCGKTTISRILRDKLGCSDNDFNEVNAAESRGIDTIREIKQNMSLAPLGGTCRVYLVDEAQNLTKDAQSAMLKMLEDCPDHVYFMLATTDPQKLLPTIRTRCTTIALKPLDDSKLKELLTSVLEKEGRKVSDAVLSKIVDNSNGSPRKALVILDSVIHLSSEDEQINAILSTDSERVAFNLAQKLMDYKSTWKDIASLINELKEEPETIRRVILGYASSVVLKSGGKAQERGAAILNSFRDNWYDCGKSGLVLACYDLFGQKQ